MADSLEYAFTCQVCFEEFEETGDHVPRLLPCTYTLCETCGTTDQGRYVTMSRMVDRNIVQQGKRKSFPPKQIYSYEYKEKTYPKRREYGLLQTA